MCLCMYIHGKFWSYFIKGYGRTQNGVEDSLFLSCVFLSLRWARITFFSSWSPCFLCWQIHSVFLIYLFSKRVIVTNETSNSCSCGLTEYFSYSCFSLILLDPLKGLFSPLISRFLMGWSLTDTLNSTMFYISFFRVL